MKLKPDQIAAFWQTLWSQYQVRARHELPWRLAEPDGSFDPYKIWVSELMLQQTQVNRVVPKYQIFLQHFPTLQALGQAKLSDVLVAWQGLGYNRRAKYLWQAAQQVLQHGSGRLPERAEELGLLPGIGPNTAAAIVVYAYNQPALFVETNVRSVYFHHFFADNTAVADAEVRNLLAQTLDYTNPREFYWALMDYGTSIKQQGHGKIAMSKHYTKQGKFEGSLRQIRGRVITLLASAPLSMRELLAALEDERAPQVLATLEQEGLIRQIDGRYSLA